MFIIWLESTGSWKGAAKYRTFGLPKMLFCFLMWLSGSAFYHSFKPFTSKLHCLPHSYNPAGIKTTESGCDDLCSAALYSHCAFICATVRVHRTPKLWMQSAWQPLQLLMPSHSLNFSNHHFILISKSSSFLTFLIHPSGCQGHQISQTHAGGWETPLETEGDSVCLQRSHKSPNSPSLWQPALSFFFFFFFFFLTLCSFDVVHPAEM